MTCSSCLCAYRVWLESGVGFQPQQEFETGLYKHTYFSPLSPELPKSTSSLSMRTLQEALLEQPCEAGKKKRFDKFTRRLLHFLTCPTASLNAQDALCKRDKSQSNSIGCRKTLRMHLQFLKRLTSRFSFSNLDQQQESHGPSPAQ